jgi:hypothetical protein
MKGIGRRLDGWPNRDLDIGKIVASAPTLKPFANLLGAAESTVRKVLTSAVAVLLERVNVARV